MNKLIRNTLLVTLMACNCASGASCVLPKAKETKDENAFTVTFFSDVHHGDYNYNDFACTNGLKKLRQILNETQNSDFYINLGDICDYLKNGKIDFYDQVMDVVQNEYNIKVAMPEDNSTEKRMYNSIGNHEAAYIKKSGLSKYIHYEEGIGSCYVFTYNNVLFMALDACFDRAMVTDDPQVLRTSTTFIIPDNEINFLVNKVRENITSEIKSIVWFSHVAFKDIENESRWKLVNQLNSFNKNLTIFEGHTHVENYEHWYDDDDESKTLVDIYTLPAVTSGEGYRYYNVTFSNGLIKNIDKHLDGVIELE